MKTFTMSMSIVFVVFAVAVMATAGPAYATLIAKDSADFSYKYEMDVSPAGQDLDSNSFDDFHALSTGGSWTYGNVDGADTVSILNGGHSSYNLLDAAGDSDEISEHFTFASGYTVETRVKAGSSFYPVFQTMMRNSGDTLKFLIGDDFVKYYNSDGDLTTLSTSDNSDAYHIFRVAHLPGVATFQIWRDNEQIGTDLGGWTDEAGGLFVRLGDSGGAEVGIANIDYIRITTGAFAPIPEPSSMALLATGLIGLLCYAWRKRR